MNRRIAASAAFTITLTTGAILTPTDAHSATGPAYTGHGWKIAAPRITHIDTKPWTIAFHDTTSRTKLTPYLRNTAAELSSYLGVKVTVTTRIVPVTVGKCPPSHIISYRYMSKPNPAKPNQSFAGACSYNHATYSAYVYINSDYWAPGRRFRESQRMNVIWHETGHAVGLTHPGTCPTDRYKRRPLMCDVDSYNSLATRRYSTHDAAGLKQLRTNRLYAYPAVTG